jgi:hypothetical protein
MSTIFEELVRQTQHAVEANLTGTGYNPISVISAEAFVAVDDLTLAQLAAVIAERPNILENVVRLNDPAPRTVATLDVVHDAIQMEIEKNIDLAPFAAQVADWVESTRVPAYLADAVASVLRAVRTTAAL